MRQSNLRGLLLFALGVCLTLPAAAESPKDKAKVKAPMFTLPKMADVPKGEGLVKPKAEKLEQTPSLSVASATYQVVQVRHAKTFAGAGAKPILPLEEVALNGNPPTSEKFSSAIRIKCPQKVSAPIEVMILDARGDTAMSASGQITFRGDLGDEAEWLVDWEPTPMRAGGNFSVLVRVAGQPLGTWPLKVIKR